MITIQEVIADMLREDTGINMLDSGRDNGRLWQINQDIKDFEATKVVDVDVYGKDDITISYNIYHYLTNFLSITEESDRLNQILNDVIKSDKFDTYREDIDMFIRCIGIESYIADTVNTYNYDNVLSTVLQYKIVEIEDDYGTENYIILQIHTGGNVRRGYTKPQIFAIDDIDYFIMAQFDVSAGCKCSAWYSDDCGYNWYIDNDEAPFDESIYMDDEGTLRCVICGAEIQFDVVESY